MSIEAQEFSKVEIGSSRSFGLVFATVLGLIGLYPLIGGSSARLWALAAASVFLLLAMIAPTLLQPLNLLWFKFGLLLGRIVSPVVMFIIYVTTVLPIGLVLRFLGKDLLRLKVDDAQQSFWIERAPPGPEPESLKDQF
jgi:predicted membrane metal-binding protein